MFSDILKRSVRPSCLLSLAASRLASRAVGPLARRLDDADERRAKRAREALGRSGRLVSWDRDPDGRWRARLSGPGLARTVERTGRTRCRAIARADRAAERALEFRARPRAKSY